MTMLTLPLPKNRRDYSRTKRDAEAAREQDGSRDATLRQFWRVALATGLITVALGAIIALRVAIQLARYNY